MSRLETREERQHLVDVVSGWIFAVIVIGGLIGLAFLFVQLTGTIGAAIIGGITGALISDVVISKWIKRGK